MGGDINVVHDSVTLENVNNNIVNIVVCGAAQCIHI